MEFKLNIPKGLEEIVKDIEKSDGNAYLVWGAVIDTIKGLPLKDWDIEVYGLSYDKLQALLSEHGKPKIVGQAFGVVKLTKEDVEYDFNIPRKENKAGVGHDEFEVILIPDMTPEEAAYRRDLTINSMFVDLSSQQLLDPYNGLSDLKQGILRHTSDKFTEDPLRVLRIMQLLPRKGEKVAGETIELCKSMFDEYKFLPKERVYEEWAKLLMKAEKPSIGLQFLVDCDWINHYPELDALRYTPQNPDWHPEGGVWSHTLMVVDNAAQLKDNLPEVWKEAYMFGCLLHDVGKPSTTDSDLLSKKHDEKGVEIAGNFMQRITDEKDLIERTLKIVKYHMRPGQLTRQNAKENAWKRLHNKIPLQVIAYVSNAVLYD